MMSLNKGRPRRAAPTTWPRKATVGAALRGRPKLAITRIDFRNDNSPSIEITLALAAGVVDIDHFQLRVEVERG